MIRSPIIKLLTISALCVVINMQSNSFVSSNDNDLYSQELLDALSELDDTLESDTELLIALRNPTRSNAARLANMLVVHSSLTPSTKAALLLEICQETRLNPNTTLADNFELFGIVTNLTIFQYVVYDLLYLAYTNGTCDVETIIQFKQLGANPHITADQGKFTAHQIASRFAESSDNTKGSGCAKRYLQLF